MKPAQSKNTPEKSFQKAQRISDAEYDRIGQELETADNLESMGKIKLANIEYKLVVQKMEKLLANNPLDEDLWGIYGQTLYRYGKYAKSIEAYKQSIQLNPGQWDVNYNLGVLYTKLKQWQLSIDSFTRVLKFRGVPLEERKYCYSFLRELYKKKKDYGNALIVCQKEWNLGKDKSWLLLESARLANLLKQPQVVQRYLKLFFKTSNEWDKLTAVKSEEYKTFRKTMLIYYYQSLEGNPDLMDSYVTNELDYYRINHASSKMENNKRLMMAEKYKAKITRQLQQYSQDGILWFQLARLCLKLKENDNYLKFCQEAYRYNPHLLQVPNSLILYYRNNKQWADSIKWINLLIRNHELGEEEIICFYMLKADLYEKMKNYGMAINAYKKCQKLRDYDFYVKEIKRLSRKATKEKTKGH